MTKPKTKLSPARNGAVYPTLKDAGLDRRFLLASVGAAALAVGLSCNTAGGAVSQWQPQDASVDASVDAALPPPFRRHEDTWKPGSPRLP